LINIVSLQAQMVEITETMLVLAEHGASPKTKSILGSDVSADFEDDLEDSGMGVFGIFGNMNSKLATVEKIYADACRSGGSRSFVTEQELMTKTKDGTWISIDVGSDDDLFDAEDFKGEVGAAVLQVGLNCGLYLI
jgi:hypothetical protein